jgi:hypothetical protein
MVSHALNKAAIIPEDQTRVVGDAPPTGGLKPVSFLLGNYFGLK